MDILRVPLHINDKTNHADALVFGPARLVGKLRLRVVDSNRSGNPAANAVKSASGASTKPRPKSVAGSRTQPATRSCTHACARTLSIRGQADVGRFRNSNHRQQWVVGQYQVLLHIDSRLHWYRGFLHYRNHGRSNRILLDLRSEEHTSELQSLRHLV